MAIDYAQRPILGTAGNVLAPLTLRERIHTERMRRNLYEFAKEAWHVVEPSTQFVPGWHLEAICEHLEAVTRGEIRNLLVNMPPRHCKSLMISTFWPMWVWCTRPDFRWLCASYALSLSIRDNRKCRILIESDWYRQRWGDVFYLAHDQNAKIRFENSAKGYRLAVSTESATTGEGGDAIIVDDPHNVRDARSDVKRDDTLLWWSGTMQSRLNDQKTGSKVVVMQRVGEMDLAGFILEQGGFELLCLPAEFEPERKCFTSIGWSDPRTVKGELLWPQQVPQKELDGLKKMMGPQQYSAQFQQQPVPAGGSVFKAEWLRYFSEDAQFYTMRTSYAEKKIVKSACWKFATVDLAASTKTSADYTVISTWAVTPDNSLLLLDIQRDRMEGPDIQQAIVSSYHRFKHRFMQVESVAFQLTMVQGCLRLGVPVHEYRPQKDKVSRAISASIFYSNEQVFHRQFADYLTDFEPELLSFPRARHDDQVDTVSAACEILFAPNQANIRTLDDDTDTGATLVAAMERGTSFWGDF